MTYFHKIKFHNKRVAALAMLLFSLAVKADTPGLHGAEALDIKGQLGQKLFFDATLSTPPGQSCASCHDPNSFFVDPDATKPTSKGALPQLKGARNAPSLLYAAFSPSFHFDRKEGQFLGGFFWDGRAATLMDQAKGPFLNPIEMANPDALSVVNKVRESDYMPLFERVYGQQAFNDTDKAYNAIADAIAAFEQSAVFRRFNSKYDYFLAGKAKFTAQEKRGRSLFEDPNKGNCAACHPSRPAKDGTPPLFTDFSYDNLGVPRNPDNPFYDLMAFNPIGSAFIDRGLGPIVGDSSERGKFKVPSLRNIAKTGPYMHNGYFKTLRGVVAFYGSRDVLPVCMGLFVSEAEALGNRCWPVSEVKKNVNLTELGEMDLSDAEIDDIVAFLNTLTDGYEIKF